VNQATGALTPLAGFPISPGLGGINSIVSERMTIDQLNKRLYVINDQSDTVSAYQINTISGALTQMPFSPISLGARNWNTIAVHPNGSPLVVADNSTNGQLKSFVITAISATEAAGSPFSMGANVAGFSSEFSTSGDYYYVGGNIGNFIGGFSVNPTTGVLTALQGAPFDAGAAQNLAYAADTTGRLFSVDSTNNIHVFSSASGILTPATGNPFPSGLSQRRFGLVHEYGANGTFYFVAGNSGNNVGVYQVTGSGTATTVGPITGSPFATGGTTANNLAMNLSGDLLFVGNRSSRNITTFRFSTIPASGMTSLGIQPNNTLGTLGALNGIGYINGEGGPCGTPTSTNTPTATPTVILTPSETTTPTATATSTPPTIQFSQATYTEDESQTAIITITRTGNTSGTSTVIFTPSDGTAHSGVSCAAGADYLLVPNPLVVFNPGDTTATALLPLCGDNIREPDETVNLTLSGANIGTPSTAVLTINDTASTFRNAANIVINGGAAGAPYPSAINVAGGPPTIGSMRVTLYDFSSQAPDNADFLLVSPNGTKFILLAGAGGLSAGGPATLNFTDTAQVVVPDNGPLTTGDFEPTSWLTLGSFPAPAPAAPYNQPGSTIGGTGTQTLFGNFGGTNSNGTWNLYVRDRSLTPTTVGNVAGGWGIEFLSSTAANASISGRVTTANGSGIRNANVVITGNPLGDPARATTGSFGYFTFEGLRTGETYVVTVNSRRYVFSTPSRVVSLVDSVVDADFVAEPLE
jgi:6-phosphogluconolactonase (cycloisomerase 2 family)